MSIAGFFSRKYQLLDGGKIQPDEQVVASSGCETGKSCVSSQQTSDTFLSDSIKFLAEQVLTITYIIFVISVVYFLFSNHTYPLRHRQPL